MAVLALAPVAAAAARASENDAQMAAMAHYMTLDCDQLKIRWAGLAEETGRMAAAERAGTLAEPAKELARLKAEFSLVGYAMLLKSCPADATANPSP